MDYKKSKINLYCSLSFLIFLLVCLTRIPFVGTYLDAILFEYIFGYVKYAWYTFWIIFTLIWLIKPRWIKKIIFSRWFVVFLFLVFSSCLLTSQISLLVTGRYTGGNFNSILNVYHEQFYAYMNGSWKYINPNITGGIIGDFVVAVSASLEWVFTILIALVLLISCVAIAFPKSRKFIKRIFSFRSKKIFSSKRMINITNEPALSIDNLPENSVNNQYLIKNFNQTACENLKKYLNQNSILCDVLEPINTPCLSQITITKIARGKTSFFSSHFQEIKSIFKNVETFYMYEKNSDIIIEYKNLQPSIVSIKNVLAKSKQKHLNNFGAVGETFNNVVLLHDFSQNPNVLVTGIEGSGAIVFVTSLFLSYVYNNNPKNLSLLLCGKDEKAIFSNFEKTKHLQAPPAYTITDIVKNISWLEQECETRKSLLELTNTETYIQHNKVVSSDSKLKKILFVLFDAEKVFNENYESLKIIEKLIHNNCHKLGVELIIHFQHISETQYSKINKGINIQYAFKTNDSNESKIIMGSESLLNLFGNGDGYQLSYAKKTKIRFQTCFTNKEIISEINKIIDNSYSH